MSITYTHKFLLGTLAAFLLFAFAGVALAHAEEEDGASATVRADARATATPKSSRPFLQNLKERRENATATRAEVRTRVRADIDIKRDELRARFETQRDEIRVKIEERREAVRARFTEEFKQRAQALVDRLEKRLAHAVEVLNDIAVRLEERIAKLEAGGHTMTEAGASLSAALGKIAEAQRAVNGISVAVDAALQSGEPKVKFKDIREAVRAAEGAIKEARRALHDVIQKIRLEAGAEADASLSASSQTTQNSSGSTGDN